MDIVMNQVTPVSREAPITFGYVKIQLYIDIYNMQIIHPIATILFGNGQHQGMLLFPTNPSQLDWGLWIYGRRLLQSGHGHGIWLYDVRFSWEPFWRAIEALSVVYADRPDLVIKHKYYLDMIS